MTQTSGFCKSDNRPNNPTYFHAATDVMLASIAVFVTFPPKAPPTRLT